MDIGLTVECRIIIRILLLDFIIFDYIEMCVDKIFIEMFWCWYVMWCFMNSLLEILLNLDIVEDILVTLQIIDVWFLWNI